MPFSFVELWHEMGPLAKGVILLLGAMSLVSLTVAIEKWLTLKRAARESAQFLRSWRALLAVSGYVAAAADTAKYPHSHVAYIIATGTRVLTTIADSRAQMEAYDRTIRRTVLATGTTVKKGLGLLATVGSTAPFVGLFGTVIGIVNAFQQMAVSGQGGLGVVSAGIAEALVATALGIGVAIPAVWLFNYLTQQITQLLSEMEGAAEELAVTALSQTAPPTTVQRSPDTDQTEEAHGNASWQQ
jgi:biopolymer transport protein ExbB/biopolymer transport protein TolQ